MMFFLLVFLLSIPFWLAGALANFQLLPGLPVSALGFLCPAMAAALLLYRKEGRAGVSGLLKRSFDFRRIRARAWLAPLILLEPAMSAVAYGVMRLGGVPVPAPQFSPWMALTLLVVFFAAGLGEELGWSGYAIDPLQDRLGALQASLVIGVIWAVWHFIPLLEARRSLEYIGWWSLGTVSARVIIVWLYNNTGRSVFVAAVFHAMINLTWQLFPINGSFYDPRVAGSISAVVAVVVAIVWGPRTLARRRPEASHL